MLTQPIRELYAHLWEWIKTGNKPLCSLPHRAPKIFGRYWICYRCMGLFIGAWSTTIIIVALEIAIHSMVIGVAAGIAILPIIFDGTRQYAFHKESTNTRRLVTGVLGGFGAIVLIAMQRN